MIISEMVHKKWIKTISMLCFTFMFVLSMHGQKTTYCSNEAFDNKINSVLEFTVPLLSVHELKEMTDHFLILDAREKEEFVLSKIPDAQYIGYEEPVFENFSSLDKSTPIVVYCSIGYRSEKIGVQLQDLGFENVYNLYGSLFEWANQGFIMHNENGEETNEIHTYDKSWSKWVDNPSIKKTW